MLGLAFTVVLVVLAWNNVVQNETRDFAFDAIAVQNSIEGSIRTADAVIDNLASFVTAKGGAARDAFGDYTSGTLLRYDFVLGMAQIRLMPGGEVELAADAGEVAFETVQALLASEDGRRSVEQGLAAGGGAVPAIPDASPDAGRLFLLQPARSSADVPRTLVVLMLDLDRLVNVNAVDPALELSLYTETEGVAGRRLVYRRVTASPRSDLVVDVLGEESVVRLGGFTVRLLASKPVLWSALDKDLVFVALFLGLGVTLLLFALARAKDIQARELEARNRVIEEQVRQQTRELAEARDEALEASRVKSDFLASMSHEIRTPLNAIIGMADLLSESRLDDEQKKYVGVFRNAGEALLSLVNDILDLSKIEAEQLTLEHIEFDLVEIVEQAVEIYALKADSRGIELVTDMADGLPRQVVGDPGRVRQIVLNLVGNAIKFTERGHIVVRVRPAGDAANTGLLHFEVADTGIGIPAAKLESIFSNFTQVDSSTTRKYGGTGLGLAICKRLAEMMGGRIWVESEEGEGSRFQFDVVLPAAVPAAPAAPGTGVSRALVAVADPAVRDAVVALLQSEGVTVESEPDVTAVAARLRQASFDVAIIEDVDDEQGTRAAVGTVGALRGGGDLTPVVCLFRPSRLARGVEELRGTQASRFLAKPIRRDQFTEAVRQACAGAGAPVAAATVAVDPVAAAARILLVEDNPDNRLLVKAYLKQEPYQIVEAENGAEAVAAVQQDTFDLVLMDVQMPVMDGYTATRAIRAAERDAGTRRVPIIALTANAVKEDIEASHAAGCDDHLTKPIKKQTLVAALRATLG